MSVRPSVGHIREPCKPTEMPFGTYSSRPKELCIKWGQGRVNPLAAGRFTRRRCGLLSKFCDYVSENMPVEKATAADCTGIESTQLLTFGHMYLMRKTFY